MSMKPEFFCCIGAELKDEIAGSLKSSRIFMYRAAESQTIADMLVDGFFNEADDLRLNDLILLYCPEQTRAITYAKVSSVSGGIIKTSSVSVSPEDIPIDTTGYSNISGSNLQQIINSIDAEFNKYLKLDGSSTMTGVLKMRASVSFECAVAPYWHGVGLYKLNDNDSVTLLASMEATDGFEPGTNNTYNIGSTSKKWKNLYLAGKAFVSTLNNGYDIAVPVTNSADTLALKSEVDLAANSGSQLYSTGVWYAKMYSATTVPTGAEYDGTNYADFSQVDGDNNPIIVIYEGQSGAWVEIDRITPPATYNGYVTITSKIWDIAEQIDQQGGQVLWSFNQKTFTPYPRIVSVAGLANTDLSNLTDTGKNIGNWSSNVTNCITNIPQDIKLELNAGTLTVKAGSKTYVPNGVDTFDELVLASDLTYAPEGSATEYDLLYIRSDSSRLDFHVNSTSGTTAPSGSGFFWNTNTNTIKFYNNGTETTIQESVPIARVHRTSGSWDRIDQVFNGFGYMGSTVFALPGVKGLIPNGRNADGTPKSTEFSLTSVITKNITLAGTFRGVGIWLTATSISPVVLGNVEGTGLWAYHEDINFNKSETGIEQVCLAGIFDISSSVISNFKQKTVFHALDWSDSNIVSGWAMPSNKYLTLTLGASGSSYTAPADGWFVVAKSAGTSGAFFNLQNTTTKVAFTSDGYQIGQKYITIPASKGDIIKCNYTFSGATDYFIFVYANGAK